MKIAFTILLLTGAMGASSQISLNNAYVDAIKLTELYKKGMENPSDNANLRAEFQRILTRYGGASDNPILTADLQIPIVAATGGPGWSGPSTPTAIPYNDKKLKTQGSAAINWQEAAIVGMADFMAARFKQEVVHFGLKNVFAKVSTEDAAIFSALFPTTFEEIKKLNGATNYYSADLIFIRQLVQTDLNQLQHRLVKEIDVIFPKLNQSPEIKDFLVLGYHIYDNVHKRKNLTEIIESLSREKYGTNEMEEVWQLTTIFSNALRDTGTINLWVDPSKLEGALGRDNLLPTYFFALLYEQLKSDKTGQKLLGKLGPSQTYFNYVRPMLAYFRDFNDAYRFVKNRDFNLREDGEGTEFLKLISRALERFVETPEVGSYVYNASDKAKKAIYTYVRISEPFWNKDYKKAIPVLLSEMNEYLPGDENKYRRSVVFFSQLGSIEDSKDMETILLAYSLPIGGSSIKRSAQWNVSLNGYVGATGGVEKAYGSKASENKGNLGLAAPIGIAVTHNKRYTVFASFIDIGSIVNVRLGNDTTAYSGLRIEQFFTPGVGLFFNARNTPLTLGFHYSYVPNLRNIKYEKDNLVVTDKNISVSRFNFSAMIDLPFFTLYNKSK